MDKCRERVAIVTGAGRGIGRAIAARLAGEGYRTVIAELNPDAANDAANAIPNAFAIPTDAADPASLATMVSKTLEKFGRLDAVVHNAGIGHGAPVEELTLEQWHKVLNTNLTAAYLLAHHGAAALRQTRGAIVHIASTRALMSEPNSEAYAASKAGLLGLTHALAASLAPHVRVNCISPGWIHHGDPAKLTEQDHLQHWAGRVGHDDDIAHLVAYLLSDRAGFITGQNFVVDGGMTRKMIYV